MSKKYGPIEPEFLDVATMDIETGSTRMNASLIEIGYIRCRIPKGEDFRNWPNFITDSGTIFFDFLEQVALNRHVDPETVKFHERIHGVEGFRDRLYRRPSDDNNVFYAKEGLELLQKKMKGVDELWLNHPTFDSGRTQTLAEAVGMFGGLWHHGAEMDVHTLKYRHGLEVPGEAAHTGLADCVYNMAILSEMARKYTRVWHDDGTGYNWIPMKPGLMSEDMPRPNFVDVIGVGSSHPAPKRKGWKLENGVVTYHGDWNFKSPQEKAAKTREIKKHQADMERHAKEHKAINDKLAVPQVSGLKAKRKQLEQKLAV